MTSPPGRRRSVLASFVRRFGAAVGPPRELIEHNWSNEVWTRGCYAGYLPPGVWTCGSLWRAGSG